MRNNVDRLMDVEQLDERTLKPVVKLVVVVAGLFLVWALVRNLPGIDARIPWATITYGAVLGAALTLGIVAVLTHVAMRLEPLVARAFAGPRAVSKGIASIVKHIVFFLAVMTAYRGLAALVLPPLGTVDLAWTYDMLFLVLGLVPTAIIAYRLYVIVDPVSSLITTRVASTQNTDRDSEPSS